MNFYFLLQSCSQGAHSSYLNSSSPPLDLLAAVDSPGELFRLWLPALASKDSGCLQGFITPPPQVILLCSQGGEPESSCGRGGGCQALDKEIAEWLCTPEKLSVLGPGVWPTGFSAWVGEGNLYFSLQAK